MVRTEEGSVIYLYTKFEAGGLIPSKVITVPIFRNWIPWRFTRLGCGRWKNTEKRSRV